MMIISVTIGLTMIIKPVIQQKGNRGEDLPLCINCKHFIPYKQSSNNNNNNEMSRSLSTCRIFSITHIISGRIIYSFADSCRLEKHMCGERGRYYEKK